MVYGNCLECGAKALEGDDLCANCEQADFDEELMEPESPPSDRHPDEPHQTVWVFVDGEEDSPLSG